MKSVTPDGQIDCKSKLEIGPTPNWEQSVDIENLLLNFKDVFSYVPGCTFTIEHDISLVATDSLRTKMYTVPVYLKPCFPDEVNKLQKQGIIC